MEKEDYYFYRSGGGHVSDSRGAEPAEGGEGEVPELRARAEGRSLARRQVLLPLDLPCSRRVARTLFYGADSTMKLQPPNRY